MPHPLPTQALSAPRAGCSIWPQGRGGTWKDGKMGEPKKFSGEALHLLRWIGEEPHLTRPWQSGMQTGGQFGEKIEPRCLGLKDSKTVGLRRYT